MTSDISMMAKQKVLYTLPPKKHKFGNKSSTNFLYEKSRNLMKGSCSQGECETRLTKTRREIQNTLSPESPPLAQCYIIRKRFTPSSQLLPEEKRAWFAHASPQRFQEGSAKVWLLSCQSWISDGTSTVYQLGKTEMEARGINCPQLQASLLLRCPKSSLCSA